MLSNLRLPRGTPIYIYFFFTSRWTIYSRNRFRKKKKGTAPKLGRILWFINCFFSLQSTRAASLPTADGLSFSSKRKAGSSRHFKWEVHMHIYTRFLWHWIDRLSIKCLCILDYFGLKYHTHSAMDNLCQPLIRLWAVLPFCRIPSRISKKSAKKKLGWCCCSALRATLGARRAIFHTILWVLHGTIFLPCATGFVEKEGLLVVNTIKKQKLIASEV